MDDGDSLTHLRHMFTEPADSCIDRKTSWIRHVDSSTHWEMDTEGARKLETGGAELEV
jgi:hypothetical protein